MATKIQAPATAKCPSCGEEAKWWDYKGRYVCVAKYTTMIGSREVTTSRHGHGGLSFTNNVGVCEGSDCHRAGTPEPSTKAGIDYATLEERQVPNNDWHGESLEGKFYCGTHSPSRKAARSTKKDIEDRKRQREFQESKEARVARETQAVEDAFKLLEGRTQAHDEEAALSMLRTRALDQITRKEYNSRW